MTQTITRLFDSRADAEAAVRELEAMGVSSGDISLMAAGDDVDQAGRDPDSVNHAGDVSRGVATGAAIGGVGGLLAGLGMLVIPGLGPLVAAGWLATTFAGMGAGAAGGALTGTLVGALTESGHSRADAEVYAESLRRGDTLVSVRVADGEASRVEAALGRYRSVSAADRGAAYRRDGWTGFDASSPMYTRDEIDAERARRAATSDELI